jgi:hypothetical protein
MHANHAMLTPIQLDSMPSQREGQDQGSTTESLHFARIAATVLLRTLLTRYRVHSHSAELRRTPLITLRPSAAVRAALTDNVAGSLSALSASQLAVDNRRHNACFQRRRRGACRCYG